MNLASDNPNPKPLRPCCAKCGWRKGGPDSWDGVACKCGFTGPPIKPVIVADHERLLEERNRLENSFGRGAFADGLIRKRIEEIDAALVAEKDAQ